jgi:hypothetical protein
MKKMMVLLKRKIGTTVQEFQDHYEKKHAVLGERFFGGLLSDFRRYYPNELTVFPPDWQQLGSTPVENAGFDAISVYSFRDDAALREYMERMKDPKVREALINDENRFLDRSACLFGFCDAIEGEGIVSTKSGS